MMSDEMKLITALCEALGFDVVKTEDYSGRIENKEIAHRMIEDVSHFLRSDRKLVTDIVCAYLIDSDGNYKSELVKPEVSYKLDRHIDVRQK